MRTTLIFTFICVFICSTGCATKTPKLTGVHHWDYERDEMGLFNNTKSNSLLGNMLSGLVGKHEHGGLVLKKIKLTPSSLFQTLEAALTEETIIVNHAATLNGNQITKLRWDISESNDGQMITDWETIDGKTVGLFWWKKQYQTEVRHIITIKRSYHSQDYSNFSIDTEVRERPNSNYQWTRGNPALGWVSFKEIKKVLIMAVRDKNYTKRIKSDEN